MRGWNSKSVKNSDKKKFEFPSLEQYKRKEGLPQNFAEELLHYQIIVDDDDEVPDHNSIAKLISLYMVI